jgi:hypothetical protein
VIQVPVENEWDRVVDSLVWLTSMRVPRQGWQRFDVNCYLAARGVKIADKSEVRFTIESPDAVRWRTHARHIGFPSEYYKALAASGGNPEHWYVTEKVPSEQWLLVERTATGEAP